MNDALLQARPNPARISALLKRYAAVHLTVEDAHLEPGDRLALRKLIEAASWIDSIYWRQRSEVGGELKQALAHSSAPGDRELERLLTINFGPWDTLDDNRPFWGNGQLPPGGALYPSDLTREELNEYLERHPDEREVLLKHTTLVRRQGRKLVAIPYEEAYRDELTHIAEALTQASDLVTHDGFRTFLRARAHGLVSGDLSHSDELWVGVADSPIDIALGPYEVYDDGLLGVKASYEATVMVRHAMTARLAGFEAFAGELERELPGAAAQTRAERQLKIGVYDVAYTAGMTSMGSKAIAATLPNDERVRMEVGARLLLFRNVIAAKFEPILKPLAARVLAPNQLALVREDAFLLHTLLHEVAHGLSTCFVQRNGHSTSQSINDALRERYSTIEECRADLLGLFFLTLLTSHGVFAPDMAPSAAVTFVAGSLRAVRFGLRSDHAQAAAIILSHLRQAGALTGGDTRPLSVDTVNVGKSVRELAETVQAIATRGDYDGSGRLIARLAKLPPEIAAGLSRTADIPVDLDFVFDESGSLPR